MFKRVLVNEVEKEEVKESPDEVVNRTERVVVC